MLRSKSFHLAFGLISASLRNAYQDVDVTVFLFLDVFKYITDSCVVLDVELF